MNAPYYQPTVAPTYAPETSRATVRIPREVVGFNAPYAPGTVVISTSERRLYLVLPGHRALKYGIGVGREGFAWAGTRTIAGSGSGRPTTSGSSSNGPCPSRR